MSIPRPVGNDAPSPRRRGPRSVRHLTIPRPRRHRLPVGPATEPADADNVYDPTRTLCSLVYVDQGLRDQVHAHFTARRHKAWVPSYAVDLIALLRHTRRADRLAAWRDWLLIIVLLADMTAVAVAAFDGRPAGIAAVIVVVLAAAVARVVLIKQKVTLKALRAVIARRWRTDRRQTAVTAGIIVLSAVLAVRHPAGQLVLLLVVAGLLVAWLIVLGFAAAAYALGARVVSAQQPRDLAKPLPQDTEDRAEQVNRTNLLVYSRDRADGRAPRRTQPGTSALGPFVGAGHRLTRWSTPLVDITAGRDGADPERVDVLTLHAKLKIAAERLHLPKLRVQHQLYVDGLALGRTPDLLCAPVVGPPLPSVPDDAVLRRIAHPADYQRGYLCLQVTDWNGDVVVTMVVRAVLDGELLHLEVSLHALPEVKVASADDPDDPTPGPARIAGRVRRARPALVVPRRFWPAVGQGLRTGGRGYWSTLFGAVRRCSGAALRPIARSVTTSRDRRTLHRGGLSDFGADVSLREELALGQRMHYNAFVDTMDHAERLQYRLVRAVADHLEACGVDIRDFTGKSETIINNNQQNIFNDLKAGAMTFGNNSPASGSVHNQPVPGAGGPPPGSA